MKNIKAQLLNLTLFEGNIIESGVSGDLFFDFLTFGFILDECEINYFYRVFLV